jgi:glycosyltransferase involved in cell wall biosynthesis
MGSGTRLKALEAFAAGRPVVGTSIGLVGLGVVDGRTALVADDPGEFAAAVVRLLRDQDLSDALATEGRRVAVKHDWHVLAEQYIAAVLG